MHPVIMQEMAKITLNERLAEAEASRMVKQAKAGQPGLSERVREGFSRFFNKEGEREEVQARLEERYA